MVGDYVIFFSKIFVFTYCPLVSLLRKDSCGFPPCFKFGSNYGSGPVLAVQISGNLATGSGKAV